MAKTRYIKTEKTGGGTDAMDGIDGALLLDQDFCWVCNDNFVDHYLLDADDGGAANPPTRIPPAVNPGTKMWIFQNLRSDGFLSVSTTSLAVGTGSKTLTVETNKGFVVGMSVKIAYTTTPTTWMHGDVTSYTAATGELIVTVTTISGSGTQAAWTISMSAPIGVPTASAANDFMVADSTPFGWLVKTLAQTKTILGLALTQVAEAVGFTISGGTTSKTLTVSADTTLDEAVSMSSKAPKANPAFTGDLTCTGNITAYYSDDRLKTRLGSIQNPINKIKTLDGFYYLPNELAQSMGYKEIQDVGVSAQRVQSILPEAVVPAPIDNNYLTVRYEKLIPLLIEGIKELEARIKKLEDK